MKAIRISITILAAALLALGISTSAFAFHSGGVAECEGCHSMHSPGDGEGGFLLTKKDQSSTCLNCHAAADVTASSYHVMTYPVPAAGSAPVERTPGGDFAWLKKNYTYTVRSTTTNELGQSHGHNIIAADFDLSVDTDFPQAPGGTFASSQLGCQSCHNVHGKYRMMIDQNVGIVVAKTGAPIVASGSYDTSPEPGVAWATGVFRLLHGGNEQGVNFPGAVLAVTPGTYNRTEAVTQTRTAYASPGTTQGFTTVGRWCAACHPDMHSTGNYVHPIDASLGATIAGYYNSYVSSGIMTGSASSSFLSLVPFAETQSSPNPAALRSHAKNNDSYLNGPATGDRVMCLSCHRAHASGWPEMLRWNYGNEFITLADSANSPVWPGTDTTASKPQNHHGRTAAETQAAYYDRPASKFGAYQRQLCNKCHAQD